MRFFDNSMVSTHRDCGEKYFFRHYMHLDRDGRSAPALAFGLAWHSAMDAVWKELAGRPEGDPKVALLGGIKAWGATWTGAGYGLDEILPGYAGRPRPQNSETALDMIAHYIEQRTSFLRSIELIAIEQPFVVPIYPDRTDVWYCGRLDKVYRDASGVWFMDHKTSSEYRKDGGFGPDFLESFSPNSQIDGYCHSGQLLFPREYAGVQIDAALVHNNVHNAFKFIPIRRDPSQAERWLHEVRDRIARIFEDERIAKDQASLPQDIHSIQLSFERNTGSCRKFGTSCAFIDLCKGSANPLAELLTYGIPEGFKEDPWSPFDLNQLQKLGLSVETAEPSSPRS